MDAAARAETPGTVAWIVAGLGNPGVRYAGTRHDVGFALVQRLAEAAGAQLATGPALQVAGPVILAGAAAWLARPQLYMNRSGAPLAALLTETGVALERLLVACDDVNLPLGSLRLRPRGSSGGHNGLKSVIGELGEEFPRLRMGVGAPPPGEDLADWVLSPFAEEDAPRVTDMLERAAELTCRCLERGEVMATTSLPATDRDETETGEARADD